MTTELSRDATKSLEAFRKGVGQEAEDAIFRAFPEKILELQKLILESSAESSPFHLSHASSSTDATVYPPPSLYNGSDLRDPKKRKLEDSISSDTDSLSGVQVRPQRLVTNKHIQVVQRIVKSQCDELIVLLDKVKLWINLQMPKIEDGDNFGVQIQEDVLGELHRSYAAATGIRDWARASNLGRAKICSKLIKYPNVEDYVLALREHDERELFSAKQHLFEIRSIYAVTMDIMHKNMTKIRTPKGNNSINLY